MARVMVDLVPRWVRRKYNNNTLHNYQKALMKMRKIQKMEKMEKMAKAKAKAKAKATAKAKAATEQILKTHCIPAQMSDGVKALLPKQA